MMLKTKFLGLETGGKPIVVLNVGDAEDLGIRSSARVGLSYKGKKLTAIVNTSPKLIKIGMIGVSEEVKKSLGLKEENIIDVEVAKFPASLQFIRNKLQGRKLSYKEIYDIVKDVVEGNLSEMEIASFVTALDTRGIDLDETASLSVAMVETGEKLKLKKKIVCDKHSIGGVAGDKTTLLLVPIVASLGLTIPKTSSRAITGASVDYNTTILLREDGRLKLEKIGKFVDEIIENGNLPRKKIEVPVFNDFKIFFRPLTRVFRHKAPTELVEITLETNRKVRLTEDHSLFTLKNGNVVSVSTLELKEGDYIVVPRKIKGSNFSEINLVSELLKKLPEKYLDKIFVLGLKKGIFEDEFSRKSQKDYMRYWRDLIPLSWLKYKSVKIPAGAKLRFRWSKKTVPVRVPLSPTLMKLLGFFAAEGHLDKNRIEFYLGREERTIAEEIENCVQNLFGLNVKISSFKQHEIEVRVDGVLLPLIFKYVLDTGENAKNKKLPWIVLNCDEEAQKEFLKAYIIGDGNKRMREHLFEVVTVSNDLANGILYLATILGIPCTYWLQREKLRRFKNYTSICKKSYRLYFTTKGLTSLINLLPTEETGLRKIARFYKNILDYKGNKWKLSHTILNQKRLSFEVFRKNLRDDCKEDKILSPLKKLSNSEIGFLKIKKIKKVKYTHPFVYDLQVEGYEKFVGGLGPIFLHNSGTADRSECLMPVNLNIEEMKEVVEKTNGCIVWGGALHLAPADDIFIQVEYPLAIDPLLFPSIMSKKKAVGAKFLVIDIPCGRGAKIKTIGDANILAKDFIELGKKLEIKTQCAITHGEEPIGYMIGSALEAREALEVLMGRNNVADLIDKATDLAAILFRMVGKKYGKQTALKALSSRKAEKKLREIIEAQGGNPKIKPEDIEVGRYKFDIFSKKKGLLLWVNNTSLTTIARAAGAPKDKGAGIKIYKKIGDTVKEGEKLLTIYAEKARKLKRAEEVLKEEQIVDVGKRMEMLIHEVREMPVHKKMFVLER